jgi:hypothetical protein
MGGMFASLYLLQRFPGQVVYTRDIIVNECACVGLRASMFANV